MANYRSPGVYVEEISTLPPSIAEVESAVPAFIGYTQIATNLATDDLAGVPTPINSMADYIQLFGGPDIESGANLAIAVDEQQSGGKTTGYTAKLTFTNASMSKHILYHAVNLYFANGGTRCYIVSVGKYGAGISETDLEAGLTTLGTIEGPTILLCPEAVYSPTPNTFNEAMLLQASTLGDRFAIIDTASTTVPKSTTSVASDTSATITPLPAGQPESSYGAVYYPFLQTSYNYQFNFDALTITTYTVNGAVPNPASPHVGATLLSLKTTFSLIYTAVLTQYRGYFITLPPSAAIAGVYCHVDATRGVWKAPANVALNAVTRAAVSVTRGEQDLLNVNDQSGKSVNAILNSPNFGTLVMGARTLDGNDNEWRYINIRRFFITVEQSIKNSTASFVFEPNTAGTWVKVQAMISNYLFLKWRDGALAGAKPDQAYFVNVGLGSTMTSLDILEGRMIIEIGMAVARPAEFVVLRFEQMLQTS